MNWKNIGILKQEIENIEHYGSPISSRIVSNVDFNLLQIIAEFKELNLVNIECVQNNLLTNGVFSKLGSPAEEIPSL